MKVAAADWPGYLPAIPFFAKMMQADVFVLADDLRYTKHSWINRARIKNAKGWQWLTVPVFTKGRLGQTIREVEIDNSSGWTRRHWKTILVNYRHAAYFELLEEAVASVYARQWTRLIDLNLAFIDLVRTALGVRTHLVRSSELGVYGTGTVRLVELCRAVAADVYLSDAESSRLLQRARLEEAGIAFQEARFEHPQYHQLFGEFVPNLSILDLLFNEGEMAREIIADACRHGH